MIKFCLNQPQISQNLLENFQIENIQPPKISDDLSPKINQPQASQNIFGNFQTLKVSDGFMPNILQPPPQAENGFEV